MKNDARYEYVKDYIELRDFHMEFKFKKGLRICKNLTGSWYNVIIHINTFFEG